MHEQIVEWMSYEDLLTHYKDGSLPENVLLSHAMHFLQEAMQQNLHNVKA